PKILFLSSFSSYCLNKWAESVPATAWTIITHSGKRKKSADFDHHKKTGNPVSNIYYINSPLNTFMDIQEHEKGN
ncbi:hypothetical protein OSK62_27440, partial [Escherichia coli]|nr:hypothetical protein [Escherichia coli]